MNNLPDELLIEIILYFRYIEIKCILNLVTKRFNELCDSDYLFKELIMIYFSKRIPKVRKSNINQSKVIKTIPSEKDDNIQKKKIARKLIPKVKRKPIFRGGYNNKIRGKGFREVSKPDWIMKKYDEKELENRCELSFKSNWKNYFNYLSKQNDYRFLLLNDLKDLSFETLQIIGCYFIKKKIKNFQIENFDEINIEIKNARKARVETFYDGLNASKILSTHFYGNEIVNNISIKVRNFFMYEFHLSFSEKNKIEYNNFCNFQERQMIFPPPLNAEYKYEINFENYNSLLCSEKIEAIKMKYFEMFQQEKDLFFRLYIKFKDNKKEICLEKIKEINKLKNSVIEYYLIEVSKELFSGRDISFEFFSNNGYNFKSRTFKIMYHIFIDCETLEIKKIQERKKEMKKKKRRRNLRGLPNAPRTFVNNLFLETSKKEYKNEIFKKKMGKLNQKKYPPYNPFKDPKYEKFFINLKQNIK